MMLLTESAVLSRNNSFCNNPATLHRSYETDSWFCEHFCRLYLRFITILFESQSQRSCEHHVNPVVFVCFLHRNNGVVMNRETRQSDRSSSETEQTGIIMEMRHFYWQDVI